MKNIGVKKYREERIYICTAAPFSLGKLLYTSGIQYLLEKNIGVNLSIYLQRHRNGDWGDVCIEDKIVNDEATKTSGRVISNYTICDQLVWIVTECDRSVTTILLPNEYLYLNGMV